MRGFTHYISGLAAATFFAALVGDLRLGILIPVIAAAAAYSPDFVDFKFGKFLERRDYEIDPAPWDEKKHYAPKLVKVSELSEENRYQFFAVEGKVEEILARGSGKVSYRVLREDGSEETVTESYNSIVFTLSDGTGKITVEAFGDDYEFFEEEFGKIEEGKKLLVFGYVDVEEDGSLKLVVSDAPHPQGIADTIARAIEEAYREGERIVKIHNIRLPGDVYRRFWVHLDPPKREVRVEMGPIVTPGGVAIGGDVPEYRKYGIAKVDVPFIKTYPKPTRIDSFSGPEIAFRRAEFKGKTVVKDRFLPWHHGFSHSLTMGMIIGLVVFAFFKLIGYEHATELALASMIGQWLHVFEDQLGFMGSNLLPPITKDVVPGFKLGESGSGLTNFSTAWLMIAFMIWNFNRFTDPRPIPISDAKLLLLLAWPSIIGFGIAIVKSFRLRKEISELMDYYTNLEAFEELEEVGGI
ncbi:metal-dependent hydrolase [Thermococcus aciditolerans]|uniref:Metal-dependent hydrolase n=1 Tax=Thermococcus aciditolerans TaxID=2598455 RepID=A0A5C0SMX9_9EURY|nr:metal-dependent hydrolase [Thermococcus aciditolerans]QEK15106.1 metal-dependent hydrolase [Thermococcus aciditolerans]